VSLRQDMLRAAARAFRRRPEAAARVAAFLRASALPDGGFANRAGASDLYYTVFGLQALHALRGNTFEPAAGAAGDLTLRAEPYLRTFAAASLDFVHTACLARCWALVAGRAPDEETRRTILARLETWRSAGGGYNPEAGDRAGTAYAAFLALGAYEDFEARLPDAAGLVRSLAGLRSSDGGYANTPEAARGSTSAAAAALVTLKELGQPVNRRAADWLLAQHCPEGGFRAMPAAPIPDLLSTATALHALAQAGVSFGEIRRPCREFVEGLWGEAGGFGGHWADEAADCEYTFYGLLALGHLAE